MRNLASEVKPLEQTNARSEAADNMRLVVRIHQETSSSITRLVTIVGNGDSAIKQ